MNKVQLIGRLTKDVERRVTQSQISTANFTVAVDRRFKDANGNKQADFINCVAWRQTADFIANYFKKGMRIGVCGSIQTRTYDDKNGQKVYVTEVLVEEAEFVESKQTAPAPAQSAPPAPAPLAPDMDDLDESSAGLERIQRRLKEEKEIEKHRAENMELPFDF